MTDKAKLLNWFREHHIVTNPGLDRLTADELYRLKEDIIRLVFMDVQKRMSYPFEEMGA
jgi:hypothetical protein